MNTEIFQSQVAQLLGEKEVGSMSAELLHAEAFRLYEQGKYSDASALFTQLVLIDPFSFAYWQGLASAKQLCRDYEAALQAWSLAVLLETQDPSAYFHVAECLMYLEQSQEALQALEAALRCCKDAELEMQIYKLKEQLDGAR
jgi:type III secretion system low calcium response chaperone LcrH/SycD